MLEPSLLGFEIDYGSSNHYFMRIFTDATAVLKRRKGSRVKLFFDLYSFDNPFSSKKKKEPSPKKKEKIIKDFQKALNGVDLEYFSFKVSQMFPDIRRGLSCVKSEKLSLIDLGAVSSIEVSLIKNCGKVTLIQTEADEFKLQDSIKLLGLLTKKSIRSLYVPTSQTMKRLKEVYQPLLNLNSLHAIALEEDKGCRKQIDQLIKLSSHTSVKIIHLYLTDFNVPSTNIIATNTEHFEEFRVKVKYYRKARNNYKFENLWIFAMRYTNMTLDWEPPPHTCRGPFNKPASFKKLLKVSKQLKVPVLFSFLEQKRFVIKSPDYLFTLFQQAHDHLNEKQFQSVFDFYFGRAVTEFGNS